ncbi:hypothetical protein L209DRAFT_342384 [Thermothelomyces heterothallicus CBS 203.75]
MELPEGILADPSRRTSSVLEAHRKKICSGGMRRLSRPRVDPTADGEEKRDPPPSLNLTHSASYREAGFVFFLSPSVGRFGVCRWGRRPHGPHASCPSRTGYIPSRGNEERKHDAERKRRRGGWKEAETNCMKWFEPSAPQVCHLAALRRKYCLRGSIDCDSRPGTCRPSAGYKLRQATTKIHLMNN